MHATRCISRLRGAGSIDKLTNTVSRREGPLRRITVFGIFILAGFSSAPGHAVLQPADLNACYVRDDTISVPVAERSETRPVQNYLGLRPKSGRLFEVDLSIGGANASACIVTGIAKLRTSAGQASLALPIRPEPDRKQRRGAIPCQVFISLTSTALEITTTQAACQAQSVCANVIPLQGQRFELAHKTAPGTPSPCFQQQGNTMID